MPSFYLNFSENTSGIEVLNDEYHHIVNVFRHKKGDVLSLINGKGVKAKGKIHEITKKSLLIKIDEIVYIEKPFNKVACAFTLLKQKNDLFIVEKLTELGVDDLFPILTKNSVKQSSENTIEKFYRTAISASKQCNNAWLPKIHQVHDLSGVFNILKEHDYLPIIASEIIQKSTLMKFLENSSEKKESHNRSILANKTNICIVIGPEGGFDKSEFDMFEELDIEQVTISKNILRAETAAICAVSQIMGIFNG
ncbi:MAG: 16S rRNA (uracil(1498)-N(3))-methyltransferase [Candidatus Cloacimonetes bacterium]|nr:16S rRNA (uracil(1498)-N(3))-methyltransferase [Candidatus Cloacimonadota bacterium]